MLTMAMDAKELDKLIRIGEGYTMEFKTSPAHIGREICAFANAAGGRILIGNQTYPGNPRGLWSAAAPHQGKR